MDGWMDSLDRSRPVSQPFTLLLLIFGAGRVTCNPMKLVGKKGVGKNEALNIVGNSPVINLFLLI